MSTRERLEAEKEQLRNDWVVYPEKQKAILQRVHEIEGLLNSMCATCHEEPRTYNEFYCSEDCETDYYGKPKNDYGRDTLTVDEMRARWKNARKHYKNLRP